MSEDAHLRDELTSALEARRELGPDYDKHLVETFLEQVDRRIAERVDARLSTKRAPAQPLSSLPLVLGSLGLAVPSSAIAGGIAGFKGIVATWLGVAAVNFAAAWGRRRL